MLRGLLANFLALDASASDGFDGLVGDGWADVAGKLALCRTGLRGSKAGLASSPTLGPGVDGVG